MPVRAEPGDQGVAVRARDGLLARRIDRRNDHRIGVVEARAELFEQITQPRVAMWLHHRNHLAIGAFPRRAQHGRDLNRVMAIVVDDHGAVPFTHAREAPA